MDKIRLDRMLVEKGYAPSGEKARALIMEGAVFVNGQREDKAGTFFKPDAVKTIEVKKDTMPYVSRGGYKLQKAVEHFGLRFDNLICLDIGASTGGFTDCMLQNGAKKVYAVDVGYGQLDYSLRTDERVICMEKTNFRYLTPADIGETIDFASADVSFISLDKILPAAYPMLAKDGRMVVLIKPQFEAGKDKVGKKGVVKERAVHEEVIERILTLCTTTGFFPAGLTHSPVKGPEGNIEYLLYLFKTQDDRMIRGEIRIGDVVNEAHASFSVQT